MKTVLDLATGRNLSEDEWLAVRRTKLTASDAASILGVDWKTGDKARSRDELWAELAADKLSTKREPSTLAQRIGHALQPMLIEHARKAYSINLPGLEEVWVSLDRWAATYDCLIPDVCAIDAKTVGMLKRGPWNEKYHEQWEDSLDPRLMSRDLWMDMWTRYNEPPVVEPWVDVWKDDQPPEPQWCQMQGQLLVRPDLKFAVLSVCLGHKGKLATYKVERDSTVQRLLVENGAEFWKTHMEGKTA